MSGFISIKKIYVYCTITFHKTIRLTQNQFLRERTKISFEARMIFFMTRPAVDDSVDQGRVSKNVRTSFRPWLVYRKGRERGKQVCTMQVPNLVHPGFEAYARHNILYFLLIYYMVPSKT
jgi:hypothetical protein